MSTYVYVYPKKEESVSFSKLLQKLTGTIEAKKRLLEDPFTFRGIREYTPDDPMNRINWKASAKSGAFMVNMQDSAASGEVYLLLDMEDETIWKYEELHEAGIRLAAALCEELLQKGVEVGLLTNGRDCMSGEALYVPARAGKGQLTRLLQSLSRIDLSRQAGKFSLSLKEKKASLLGKGSLCILITKNQYQELVQEMEELGRKNQGSVFLATLYREMEFRVQSGRFLQAICWEVKK